MKINPDNGRYSVRTGSENSKEDIPFVSVIIPVFNEEHYLERNLRAVLRQDYPADRWELIVADGMSTDRTREIVRRLQQEQPRLQLIENPRRIVSTGLNHGISAARGEIIVRLDGHCEYPADYLRQVVRLREQTGADNVGGVLVPVGTSYRQRAIVAAYSCPGGLGGTALKAASGAETVREVDAVHGGCWRRDRLLAVGGFDEEMVRNQDDELSFRLRKNAGRIYQSLAIRVRYHVRNSLRCLFLQFAQYGYWKVRVVRKHPRQASIRHFVPAALVVMLVVGAVLAPLSWWVGLGGSFLAAGYAFSVAAVALVHAWPREKKLWPGMVAAIVLMHFGYGLGFLLGWLRVWVGPLPTDALFERSSR